MPYVKTDAYVTRFHPKGVCCNLWRKLYCSISFTLINTSFSLKKLELTSSV